MKLNGCKFLMRATCLMAMTVLLAGSSLAQDIPDYKTVISDYIEATGGKVAHQGLESLVAEGKISIAEAGIEGTMDITQSGNKGYMKMNMAGIGEQTMGFDGETAWSISEMTGPEIIEGEQRDQMIMQMNLSPMLNIDEMFDTVECTGIEEFNGEDCYVIEAKKEGQETVFHYFSVESKLQTGTIMTAASQMGKMEIVSKLSDYRDVSGIKMPFMTMAELPQGMTLQTEIVSMEANAEIDDSKFELPDEIKELVTDAKDDDDGGDDD